MTVVWVPNPRTSGRRCVDCGEFTVDQHRITERCRRCWVAEVHAKAAQRAEQREAERAARAALRELDNARKRAASAVRCEDCGVALTTRHRHVKRCRDCWKAAVRGAAAPKAAEVGASVVCPNDGCLLVSVDEQCPACATAAS